MRSAALFLLAAVVLVGCFDGDGDPTTTTTTARTTTTTTGATTTTTTSASTTTTSTSMTATATTTTSTTASSTTTTTSSTSATTSTGPPEVCPEETVLQPTPGAQAGGTTHRAFSVSSSACRLLVKLHVAQSLGPASVSITGPGGQVWRWEVQTSQSNLQVERATETKVVRGDYDVAATGSLTFTVEVRTMP